MTSSVLKTIKVSDANHKALAKLGTWNESMDSIIGKLIAFYEGKGVTSKK